MSLMKKYGFLISVTGTIVLLDQWTKWLVRSNLPAGAIWMPEELEWLSPYARIVHWHNTGAAFGMLNALDFPGKTVVLTLVATVALSGVAWYSASVPASDRLARLGVASILGGAIGNLIDRATAGYVLDFVDASWQGWHFWAFNVADAAITVGVILMILDLLGLGRRASNPV